MGMGLLWRNLDCADDEADRRNQIRTVFWFLLWMVSWMGVLLAIRQEWLTGGLPTIVLSLGTLGLGVFSVVTYRRYLAEADELRRKIEIDALAAAFGVGVVGGLTLFLFQRAGIIGEVDVPDVIALMFVTHAAGIVLGRRRYS